MSVTQLSTVNDSQSLKQKRIAVTGSFKGNTVALVVKLRTLGYQVDYQITPATEVILLGSKGHVPTGEVTYLQTIYPGVMVITEVDFITQHGIPDTLEEPLKPFGQIAQNALVQAIAGLSESGTSSIMADDINRQISLLLDRVSQRHDYLTPEYYTTTLDYETRTVTFGVVDWPSFMMRVPFTTLFGV